MCVLSSFFNYFNPKHLPENNIPLNILWNKVNCDDLGSWCISVVTSVPAVQSSGSPAGLSELQHLWPHPRPAEVAPVHIRGLWSIAGHHGL